jgi:hypothetical protein
MFQAGDGDVGRRHPPGHQAAHQNGAVVVGQACENAGRLIEPPGVPQFPAEAQDRLGVIRMRRHCRLKTGEGRRPVALAAIMIRCGEQCWKVAAVDRQSTIEQGDRLFRLP